MRLPVQASKTTMSEIPDMTIASDYRNEDVLKHACEAFIETIKLKVEHLRRCIKKGSNPALTGTYIEEVVKAFIRNWVGHRHYVTGAFYSEEFSQSDELPQLGPSHRC